jgi:hypothetical protein
MFKKDATNHPLSEKKTWKKSPNFGNVKGDKTKPYQGGLFL